ncbi:MAG: alpha/beta hydrolase [bacterium]
MLINLIKWLIIIAIGIIFIKLYFKHFERRSIYFPSHDMDVNPGMIGLAYEDIYFETEDRIKLNAWYIPAKNPIATLLFCHGNAGNISHRLESIRVFNELNLNVFIFDYRGYGKSKGRISEEGSYCDAKAAYYYILSHIEQDKNKIVLFGKSLGAAVAIDLASKVDAKALISESGFTSVIKIGQEVYPFLPVKWFCTIKYDSLSKIKTIHIPKLIIHSKNDEMIPFHHGKELFDAAHEPKEFYILTGLHNDSFFVDEAGYKQRIKDFLEKYLMASEI